MSEVSSVEMIEGIGRRPIRSGALLAPGSSLVFWGTCALATSVGLLVQLFILPMLLPALHAGHGLQLGGDWIAYHEDGVKLAKALARQGWRAFELRPGGNFPVAESGLLYFITGIHEPWVLVPVNSALFSMAVVGVFNIYCRVFDPGRALLGILPLIALPGSTQFYTQVEKDVWAFAGSVWLLTVLIVISQHRRGSVLSYVSLVGVSFIAAALGWIVRPYFSSVQMGALVCAAAIGAIQSLKRNSKLCMTRQWLAVVCCFLSVAVFAADGPARVWLSLRNNNPSNLLQSASYGFSQKDCDATPTILDSVMPLPVRQALNSISHVRVLTVQTAGRAGSAIDNSVCFVRPSDLIYYIPRALEIALFAPFPSMWFERGQSIGASAMRLISGAEMLVAYILLPGILILLWREHGCCCRIASVLAFILPIAVLMAVAIPNVGTLYRMRYGYLQILVGLGLIGWARVFCPSLCRKLSLWVARA